MKLQLMVLGHLRSPTYCTQPTCCVVKKALSTSVLHALIHLQQPQQIIPHNRCWNPGEGMWDVSGMLVALPVSICVYGSCTFSNIEFLVYLSVVLHDFVNGSVRALVLPPA